MTQTTEKREEVREKGEGFDYSPLSTSGASHSRLLAEHLTAHLATPFAWGTHDCVSFAAAWVQASTGVDHLAGLGQWTTAAQAVRAINKAGGSLEAALDARFQRIDPNFAQDGDLALYDGCLCIFSGAHIVGPGKTGLTHNSRVLAQAAWAIAPPKNDSPLPSGEGGRRPGEGASEGS